MPGPRPKGFSPPKRITDISEEVSQLVTTPKFTKASSTDKDDTNSLRGYVVRTQYGWGIVIGGDTLSQILPDWKESMVPVALDWRLGDGKRVKCTVRKQDILDQSLHPLGSCVLTTFGTGVVLDFRRTDNAYRVRLWRDRGAGSADLWCFASAIRKRLVAAVGLRVETPYGSGVVERYREFDSVYVVRYGWGGQAFLQEDCITCTAARVMPCVESFMAVAGTQLNEFSNSLKDLYQVVESAGLDKLLGGSSEAMLDSLKTNATGTLKELWQATGIKNDGPTTVGGIVEQAKVQFDGMCDLLKDEQMSLLLDRSMKELNKLAKSNTSRLKQSSSLVDKLGLLDGKWVGEEDGELRGDVTGRQLVWHWGEVCTLTIDGVDVSLVLEGEDCSATLGSDGRLTWSDGDVWVRHTIGGIPQTSDVGYEEAEDAEYLSGDEEDDDDADSFQSLSDVSDGEFEKAARLAADSPEEKRARREARLKEVEDDETQDLIQQGKHELARVIKGLNAGEQDFNDSLEILQKVAQKDKRMQKNCLADREETKHALEIDWRCCQHQNWQSSGRGRGSTWQEVGSSSGST